MKNNDKYNIIKKMLENGEKDFIIIGKSAGYNGATDKRIGDSARRIINNKPELKLLYDADIQSTNNKEKKQEEENYYKGNEIAPIGLGQNIETWEQLLEVGGDNPLIKLIDERFQTLENNKNNYEYNNIIEGFVLDEKYTDVTSDEIVTVSLRMTKTAKKKLERFAKDNSQYKKVHITSQIIEEYIKQYM